MVDTQLACFAIEIIEHLVASYCIFVALLYTTYVILCHIYNICFRHLKIASHVLSIPKKVFPLSNHILKGFYLCPCINIASYQTDEHD